ncbi:MAG: DUF3574 domain-containing protein [Piscinibacter sp.]
MFRPALLVALGATLAGCAGAPLCGSGQSAAVQDLIYFGTDTPAGAVSAQAWAEFLSETVTPRFPDGLSVWPASGQWRSSAGAVIREPSYVLSLVHSGNQASELAVLELIQSYKARFQQEAVLRVRSAACMSL